MKQLVATVSILVLVAFGFAPAWAGMEDRFSDIELKQENYIEFPQISAPSDDPDTDTLWLYAKDKSGTPNLYFEVDDGTVTDLSSILGTASDFALTADADAGDYDIKSLDKLEFYDSGLYIDGGADGTLVISTDGTLQVATNDWDISTTGTITNASMSADQISAAALDIGDNSLSIGSDPADSGAIRLDNAAGILFEASAAGTDVNALSVDASEVVQIGSSGASGVTITPDTTISGTLSVSGTLYESAIAPSSGNLTVNAAGAGTIQVGNSSTGAITLTGGGVDIGDGAADTLTITGIIDADVTFDDGTTDSPKLIFKDSDDEQGEIYQDQSSDDLNVEPNDASDSLAVTVGNLSSGTPNTDVITLDGGDFFVEDDAEIDGTLVIDGLLDVNEDIDVDFDSNDEEISIISTASGYAASSGIVQIYDDSAGQSNQSYLLRLAREADGDAQDYFLEAVDNSTGAAANGDTKFTLGTGGSTVWTLDAASSVQLDADTANTTTTGGVLDIDFGSATDASEAIDIAVVSETSGVGEMANGISIDLDDDTSALGKVQGIYINSSDTTGSSVIKGLVVETNIEKGIDISVGAGNQAVIVDAASTINTGTSGVMDYSAILSEDTASFMNLDVESEADGAGEIVHGLFMQLDDDADNADNELRGLHIQTDGSAGTGIYEAIHVEGANLDAALQADTGYVRIGTGATPDVTPGNDDLFVEGTVEIDGDVRMDGLVYSPPLTETVTTEADITDPLTSMVLLVEGDNDADNDTIDLQDGTYAGQPLLIVAHANVDADDTITINFGDTTATNAPAVSFNKLGENVKLTWTGATIGWVVESLQDSL